MEIDAKTHFLSLVSQYGDALYDEGYAEASCKPEKARKNMEKRKALATEIVSYFDDNFRVIRTRR